MNYKEMPKGYELLRTIDLQKDKKLALIVNGLGLAIMVVMVAIAWFFVPITTFYEGVSSLFSLIFKMGMILVALVVYIIGHELIHGVYMKKFSGVKPKYGFTGLYAYAGSSAFFDRRSYLIIAMAPVALFGALFMVLNFALPVGWFWFVYFLQIMNISGAAGDFYVSVYMSKLPRTILVRDSGVSMEVFAQSAKSEGK
jgi:hypothetical protein